MYPGAYHKTTSLDAQMQIQYDAAAKTQDELILEIMRKANRPLAWGEVKGFLPVDMHEGSVKRALSNLADRGLIVKCKDDVIEGPYGKPTHRYKLTA